MKNSMTLVEHFEAMTGRKPENTKLAFVMVTDGDVREDFVEEFQELREPGYTDVAVLNLDAARTSRKTAWRNYARKLHGEYPRKMELPAIAVLLFDANTCNMWWGGHAQMITNTAWTFKFAFTACLKTINQAK